MAGRERPRDLREHACLGYTWLASGETWHFTGPDGAAESVTVKGPLSATNGDALAFALEAGLGIALQPDFLAWEAVRDGRLVRVLDDWDAPPLALHLVTPAGAPRPIRVAVLLEFLARRFTSGDGAMDRSRHRRSGRMAARLDRHRLGVFSAPQVAAGHAPARSSARPGRQDRRPFAVVVSEIQAAGRRCSPHSLLPSGSRR